MPRKVFPLERRLREWVRARLIAEGRCSHKRLARTINEPDSFVTDYLKGVRHANLDRTLTLLRAFGVTLEQAIGADALPDLPAEDRELREVWHRLDAATRADMLRMLRGIAERATSPQREPTPQSRPHKSVDPSVRATKAGRKPDAG